MPLYAHLLDYGRRRKARKLARMLVALDDVSRERRTPVRERRRASLGLGRAA